MSSSPSPNDIIAYVRSLPPEERRFLYSLFGIDLDVYDEEPSFHEAAMTGRVDWPFTDYAPTYGHRASWEKYTQRG
jgi:hypothetical protein